MDNTNGDEEQSESSSISLDQPIQEPKCCEICGNVGDESLLMTCSSCRETREHTYCAQVFLPELPPMWVCEECRSSSRALELSHVENSSSEISDARSLMVDPPSQSQGLVDDAQSNSVGDEKLIGLGKQIPGEEEKSSDEGKKKQE